MVRLFYFIKYVLHTLTSNSFTIVGDWEVRGMEALNCGLTKDELSKEIGTLNNLTKEEQSKLVELISRNNQSIEDYISQATDSERIAKDIGNDLMSQARARGMRF